MNASMQKFMNSKSVQATKRTLAVVSAVGFLSAASSFAILNSAQAQPPAPTVQASASIPMPPSNQGALISLTFLSSLIVSFSPVVWAYRPGARLQPVRVRAPASDVSVLRASPVAEVVGPAYAALIRHSTYPSTMFHNGVPETIN